MRRFQPMFFLFLIVGPFVVIPYLIASPAFVTLRAAWNRTPKYVWRLAIVISIDFAFLVTQPSSPIFIGLDAPIPPSIAMSAGAASSIVETQIPYVNAALIFLFVLFPLSAASTYSTMLTRRKSLTQNDA